MISEYAEQSSGVISPKSVMRNTLVMSPKSSKVESPPSAWPKRSSRHILQPNWIPLGDRVVGKFDESDFILGLDEEEREEIRNRLPMVLKSSKKSKCYLTKGKNLFKVKKSSPKHEGRSKLYRSIQL